MQLCFCILFLSIVWRLKMNSKVDIHADDYGYSIKTSEDILDCMKQGKLDSVSIICNTAYFEQSMKMLYEQIPDLPYLPLLSIHLNLPEGKGVTNLLPISWGRLFISSYTPGKAKIKDKLKQEGLPINDMTKDMEIVDALYREASEGNVAAFNAIRDIRGEKPNEKISLNGNMMNEVKIRYVGMDGEDIHFPSSEDEVDLTRGKKE